MTRHPYIAIEGPIGVGKTTLARILGEALPSEVLLEVFEQNPFLGDFYSDRARYAFQTQLFFLLSRYHQQRQVIAETISRTMLASDYLFAKDWLFAHLNLQGDELAMYERVHAILGEQIPAPDLVVFLKASTDTLMQRIAFRDRPYERQMDREYIHALRLAYEGFFADYTTAPVLAIDTDHLDIVRNGEARNTVVAQVRGALGSGSQQLRLLDTGPASAISGPPQPGSRLGDWQRFQRAAEARQGAGSAVLLDFVNLAAQLGSLGGTVARIWQDQERYLSQAGNQAEARGRALAAAAPEIETGLAEALSQILQLANDAGINLEDAYLKRIKYR